MSEHEHEYQLDVQGGYYYCDCGEGDIDIAALMKEYILVNSSAEMLRRSVVKLEARIKALEGVVELAEEFIETAEEKIVNHYGYCPLCEGKPECVVENLKQALKKLEGA